MIWLMFAEKLSNRYVEIEAIYESHVKSAAQEGRKLSTSSFTELRLSSDIHNNEGLITDEYVIESMNLIIIANPLPPLNSI